MLGNVEFYVQGAGRGGRSIASETWLSGRAKSGNAARRGGGAQRQRRRSAVARAAL